MLSSSDSEFPAGVEEYAAEHKLPFKIMIDNDPYDMSTLDIHGTPQTLLLVANKVVHNWSGAYFGDVKAAIEKNFGVSLPSAQM